MPLKHYSNGLQFRLVGKIKLWNLKITSSKKFQFQGTNWKETENQGDLIFYLDSFVLNDSVEGLETYCLQLSPIQCSDFKRIHVLWSSSQQLETEV